MKLEAMLSPGMVPNGQQLRTQAMKAINFVEVVALQYPDGEVDHAKDLQDFFLFCASAVAAYVPTGP